MGTQRLNRKHTWNTLPITGCCFSEYALSFKQFVRNMLTFFKYFNCLARWTMTRLFAVYIFYQNKTLYYHQQNCLFPSASRLVLQTCIVLIGYMIVCMLCVRGKGGGSGFPAALSAHWARWTLANFLDPDQTALQFVWSESTLFTFTLLTLPLDIQV